MNKLLAITVLVALLALSAESFRVPRRVEEEQGILAQFANTVKSQYDQSVSTVRGYVDDLKGLKLEEKAWNVYEDTTKAIKTYAGIVQDQLYYMFYAQQ